MRNRSRDWTRRAAGPTVEDVRAALVITALAACGSPAPRGPDVPGPAPPAARAASRPELAGAVAVEEHAPERVRVRLEDLPAPFATESARRRPEVVDPPAGARLRVPPGFAVQVFAAGLEMPRWLAATPEGDVLVTETRADRIRRLVDGDGDGVAERVEDFAGPEHGLDIPFGMAFVPGAFFVGNHDEVRRYDYAEGQGALVGEGARVLALPGGGYRQHWTRNVVPSPDGQRLFVSVGSRTNVDPEDPPRASVLSMRLDGSDVRTFASGLRNPVGLAFHPTTGELYCTVNERDHLGDDLVPDFFTRLREGEFYGWPYAYLSPARLDPRRVVDGRSEAPELAARTRTPDVLIQAHSAALGVAFQDHPRLPDRYRRGAFVALRGSWNRDRGTGYRVVFLPFGEDDRPAGDYEDFVSGFLIDPAGPTTWGRPVGVLARADGSLLFTEEFNGRVYRVSHRGLP